MRKERLREGLDQDHNAGVGGGYSRSKQESGLWKKLQIPGKSQKIEELAFHNAYLLKETQLSESMAGYLRFIIHLLLPTLPPKSAKPLSLWITVWGRHIEQLQGSHGVVCTNHLSDLTLPYFLTCCCVKYHLHDVFQQAWPELTFSSGQKTQILSEVMSYPYT